MIQLRIFRLRFRFWWVRHVAARDQERGSPLLPITITITNVLCRLHTSKCTAMSLWAPGHTVRIFDDKTETRHQKQFIATLLSHFTFIQLLYCYYLDHNAVVFVPRCFLMVCLCRRVCACVGCQQPPPPPPPLLEAQWENHIHQ